MKLIELEPEFLKLIDERSFCRIDAIAEADGVMFLCPMCFKANGGPVGTHRVICWSPRVPISMEPRPGRWELRGNGFQDLTLTAGSSSVALGSGCRAHFFVTNGEIVN
jgi:hypothetical protein